MLTRKQILYLIELTQRETVATFDGYVITRRGGGYSRDQDIAHLQTTLSIMLEAAPREKP